MYIYGGVLKWGVLPKHPKFTHVKIHVFAPPNQAGTAMGTPTVPTFLFSDQISFQQWEVSLYILPSQLIMGHV
jgi:hypothetical protein